MSTAIAARATPIQGMRRADYGMAAAIVLVLALLVLPLPPVLLDLALALSIGASLAVLLVAVNTAHPLDFSTFPTVLLVLTLFRLALNVSSTRLILSKGEAGRVIEAFGEFVVGGNYAVGAIIFLILIAINFVVITKGAGRIAEVAARFTLDAMPGRQMSIDGDLSAGLIDDVEAKRRREEIAREADFYGAMDGAAKFVRGDAIAGLIITGLNIVGGIFVGMVQRGMPLSEALSRYTVLTVGDGLVSQIPALMVSTAAGIMVTHAADGERVGTAMLGQIAQQPRALWTSSVFLTAFGLVPGLPTAPFLVLAGAAALAAAAAGSAQKRARAVEEVQRPAADAQPAGDSPVKELLQIDPVELEVGYGLIPLVDEKQGGDLLERIRLLRKQAALELGILIPPIRIRDDMRLGATDYVIRLRGSEIARGEVFPRLLLALDTGGTAGPVEGVETKDPSFGMPARWISPALRAEAEAKGYTVVEPSMVMATHLIETLKRHAADLLSRQDVKEMLDALKQSFPALVEEVVPAKVPLGVVHRVLQRLVREQVPIRDLVTILEALADAADTVKDPEALTEHVRRALSKAIAEMHMGPSGVVRGIALGPKLEAALMGLFAARQAKPAETVLDPDALAGLLRRLEALSREHGEGGRLLPLITPPSLRVGIRRLLEPVLPAIPVISLAELPPQVNVQTVATWELPDGA
ncbi:MAG TPA: flagellar biosynthesis protein FlhA [Longimicrobiales bacterium]